MSRRLILLVVLAGVALLLALGAVAWRGSEAAPVLAADDLPPPGRWTPVPTQDRETRREMAATLSLPYLSGSVTAGGRSGVVTLDRERVQPGVNLVVSAHAPEAALMDLEGEVLHRWRVPVAEAFPRGLPGAQLDFVRRARLLPDGSLITLFQGGGLVKIDRHSEIIWATAAPLFNDLRLDGRGRIWTLWKEPRRGPGESAGADRLEDFVALFSPEGKLLERHSLLRAMQKSRFADLLSGMSQSGDMLHSNTVRRMDGSLAAKQPLFADGNILFSLRQVGVVGVLSSAGDVLWAQTGAWRMQHEPVPLPSGNLLLFDNRGGEHTRALEITVPEGEIVWQYDGPGGRPLYSPQGGTVQPLENGNILITASESGRSLEITPEKEIVWEYLSPHRTGRNGRLVATLWDVIRMEPPEWLDDSR